MTARPRSQPSGVVRAIAARPTIVVVEDHPSLRDAIAEALAFAGWDVRAFGDVVEAHRAVRAAPPDLVLTDLNVGTLSGGGLARELRLDPSTSHIPCVAMSGSVQPTRRLLWLFDLFLLKPVDLTTLDATLRELLDPDVGAEVTGP